MRLVMTLLVRDERDIIDENIRFHLGQSVDFIIATDNGSKDGTLEILEEYAKRGVLHLIQEPSDDYSQSKWVTRMARLAAGTYGADWVINNDADEFWYPQQDNLKVTLSSVSSEIDRLRVQRRNFLPVANDSNDAFYERMLIREEKSCNALGKPLPPKVCHRACRKVVVHQGNHRVDPEFPGGIRDTHEIDILHFPMRSYAQFENKIRLGGAAYQRNKDLPKSVGGTWRHLYELYQRGELYQYYRSQVPTPEDVTVGLKDGRLCDDRRLLEYFSASRG